MPHVLVRHKVRDYTSWKAVFDAHGSTRKEAGSQGGYLFRSAADPEEVVLLLEWDTLEHAQQFAGSQDLKSTMERAGVMDQPDIFFLEQVDLPQH